MANKKNTEYEVYEEIVEVEREVVRVEVPAPTAQVRPRGITLEQYASQKGIKPQHLGGMRAFISNPSRLRTLEGWESVFSNY